MFKFEALCTLLMHLSEAQKELESHINYCVRFSRTFSHSNFKNEFYEEETVELYFPKESPPVRCYHNRLFTRSSVLFFKFA